MAMTEAVSDFFDTEEFAEPAIWKGTVPVTVIFDNAYAEQFGLAGTNPVVLVVESDFLGIEQGQLLLVKSVQYEIVNIQPDGTGMLNVELSIV